MTDLDGQELVAIVGMAGRFPGAASVDELWSTLRAGVESIRPFTDAELEAAGADPSEPGFVNAGAVMDGIDAFDAAFFGMSRREAELTDPQHRVFLECAWSALEHAGYDPGGQDGRVGVFGGVAANTYYRRNVMSHPELLARTGDYPLLLATEREYAITRASYKIGLQGPAISVNTACSTSAVAVHLAVQSLLAGESDIALAGGARIRVPATGGYVYQEDGILSPDGHCRAFDAEARGTVVGNGVAIVVLRRLSDAQRDGDTVYAVIRGSAVNNDGSAKIGYTAPSIEGQVKVIEEALAVAGVDADTIGMVEAHGTGTSLGDPIEVAALTQAYRHDTSRRQYCAIGSLKTNIGHLDAGAGVAGLIKAALALHHEEIPASLNYRTPNPQIDFGASPFFVNTELRPWPRSERPRRAGVSAFGLGGTNAHIVLEEAPLPAASQPSSPPRPQVLVLSAKSATALERVSARLADHLDAHRDDDLADVAWSLQVGRARLPHRRALVVEDRDDAVRRLRQPNGTVTGRVSAQSGTGAAFLFPGQGALQPNMGVGLYRAEPVFAEALDRCAEILAPLIGADLRAIMFPPPEEHEAAVATLEHAGVAQPATFVLEYALATLWMSWGVRPAVMVGHSMGEFVAACLGGVFGLDDALRIIAGRGRLMQELDGGSMLAVMRDAEAVVPLLDASTSLAAINAPARCVASGPAASISALEERLLADGADVRRLPIGHAAHSPMMDPMVGPLRDLVAGTTRGSLTIPMISTATGDWVRDGLVADPEYWGRHARDTVRFSEAAARLLERPDLVVIEVGPGQSLGSFVRQQPRASREQTVIASVRHPDQDVDDRSFILRGLGQAWAAGVDLEWSSVHGTARRRLALPTYPFERVRHWIEPAAAGDPSAPRAATARSAPPSSRQEAGTPMQEASLVGSPGGEVETASGASGRQDGAGPSSAAAARVRMEPASRHDRIAARLAAILSDLSGVDAAELEPLTSFIDLGFDSLFLTQANSQFRKQFGVRITFRQLFEEAPSIDSLARFIDGKLPPDAFPPEDVPAEEAPSDPPQTLEGPRQESSLDGVAAAPGSSAGDPVERLIREQLRVMEKQLELLRSPGAPPAAAGLPTASSVSAPRETPHYLATSGTPGHSGRSQPLTSRQQDALDDLVHRYNARTAGSKRLAQAWRTHLADNRAIISFDPAWKELVYQIVSERSLGSRIWDVDGNEYVDTALGFGTNLFGHSPAFISAALHEQLERGWEVGVQNRLLGEVSELVCGMTGNERLAYTYSGGEAVEAAIRVARTVTGRDGVAYFTDDIHGRSDVVLGRGVEGQGEFRTVPMVAGVPQRVVDDALVLPYGEPRALEAIRARAADLALVLVEPVRTRNPDLQPLDFLRRLRAMADEHGFLLVFDEVVTGFRAHPGGVQALFGIRADITTYGKVVGGGMPVGLVAGASRYIDVIDGGSWSYGDDSFPEADITASGGTFIKHPLTLAAARGVLHHLREHGPSLQEDLNRRTGEAVVAINEGYATDGLPIHVEHFSSFFRPTFGGSSRFAGLFQYYLRDLGVHTNPPSPSFLSTAHSEADVEAIVAAYLEAGRAMARGGFFEEEAGAARSEDGGAAGARSTPAGRLPGASTGGRPLPVLPNVARFLVERSSPAANHWNLGVLLSSAEPLDPGTIRSVVERLAARHHALRLRFHQGVNGWASTIAADSEPPPFSSHDLSALSEAEQTATIEERAGELQRSLDLQHGPLFRVATFDLGPRGSRLLVITHHFVMDGLSWRPFWEDFVAIEAALERGEPDPGGAPATSFEEWAHRLKRRADSDELRGQRRTWLDLGWDRVRPIPFDRADTGDANTNASAREVVLEFSTDETRLVFQETPGVPHKVDLLLSALAQTLGAWTGTRTALFDMMGHGRDEEAFDDVDLFGAVGFFISYTPMVLSLPDDDQPAPLLTRQIQPILRMGLDFDLLRYMTSDGTVRQVFGALPRAQVLFNHLGRRDELDTVPPGSRFSIAPESMGPTHSPQGLRYYPLAISSQIWRERLQLTFVYSENLHEASTIERLAESFRDRLLATADRWRGVPRPSAA